MLWYSSEAPLADASNEYHNIFFFMAKKEKNNYVYIPCYLELCRSQKKKSEKKKKKRVVLISGGLNSGILLYSGKDQPVSGPDRMDAQVDIDFQLHLL